MTQQQPLQSFTAGIRACAPLLMGVVPFGIVCGASAAAAGLPVGQSFALSWLLFAGSSQIVFTQLYGAGAPAWVVVLTAWVVNLRFMMYSVALAPHCRELSPGQRWLAAYLLTDQAFALGLPGLAQKRAGAAAFYFGVAATLWTAWQAASLAGIFLGALIPASWSMDFVVALTFIALLAPLLRDRRMLGAAAAGGIASVALQLPLKLNIMAAAFVGIGAGLLLERRWPRH